MNALPEKLCPACGHKNRPDAETCIICGTPLEKANGQSDTSTLNLGAERGLPAAEETITELSRVPPPIRGVAIYLAGDIKPIAVMYDDEFVLGRVSDSKEEASSEEIIVDLRPYGALEKGVSRRHLLIRRASEGYEVMDLGSTNGSYLLDKRMLPNQPYPLSHGDLIRMGKMRIFITFREDPRP
ncbi:MAG: FHA domain-containing protein [Anaerolineales bacterium]